MSFFVAESPASSLSVISPLSARRSNALASLVVSLGTAILAPSERSPSEEHLPAYMPNGS